MRSYLHHRLFLAGLAICIPGISTATHAQQPLPVASPTPSTIPAPVTHPFQPPLPPPPQEETVTGSDGTTVTKIRPLRDGTPAPSDPKLLQEHQRRLYDEYYQYYHPPVSIVAQTGTATIYSQYINRPLCVAYRGTKEWIGTAVGVKCIDKQTKTVRIYAAEAGLPLGSVDYVATDDSGENVVALVQQFVADSTAPDTRARSQYAVCVFESSTGKWRMLGKVPAPTPLYIRVQNPYENDKSYPALYRLALTKEQVVIFAGGSRTDAPTACLAFDRATGASLAIPWPENLQADFSGVQANAVLGVADKFYLASDIGLFCYDTATKTWRRFLPAQEVLAITPIPSDANMIAILSRPRTYNNGRKITVSKVSLRTGKILGAALESPVQNEYGPGLVSFAPDGTVWLTTLGAFYRVTPAGDKWEQIADDGSVLTPEAAQKRPVNRRGLIGDIAALSPVASEERIPDSAVIARVRLAPVRENNFRLDPFENEAMRWIRQRLSRWLSPVYTPENNPVQAISSEFGSSSSAFVDDPSTEGMAWGIQNGKLIRLPKQFVPPLLRYADYPRTTRSGPYVYQPISDTAPVQQFRLYDAAGAKRGDRIPVSLSRMIAVPGAKDAVYVTSDEQIRRYDGETKSWYAVASPGEQYTRNPFVVSTPVAGAPVLLSATGPALLRLRTGASAAEVIPFSLKQQIRNLSQRGLWNVFSRNINYLPISDAGIPQGDWQKFEEEAVLPATDAYKDQRVSNQEYIGSTGTIAWFALTLYHSQNSRRDAVISGFDVRTGKWTEPLPIVVKNDRLFMNVIETPDGGALIGVSPNIYRYQPGSTTWQQVDTPPVPLSSGEHFRVAAAANGDIYALNTQESAVFDARKRQWFKAALPAPLRYAGSNPNAVSELQLATTQSGIYAGQAGWGIWHWRNNHGDWKPILETIHWSPDPRSLSCYNLSGVAADTNAVWAFGYGDTNYVPLVIRWDKKSQKAQFVRSTQFGFPLTPSGRLQMVGVASGALLWQRPNAGVYRAVANEARFERISDIKPVAASTDPDDPSKAFLLTTDTLYRYDGRTGQLTAFVPSPKPIDIVTAQVLYLNPPGLSSLIVTSGSAYVGTSSGVYRFDTRTEQWRLLPDTQNQRISALRREGNILVVDTTDVTLRIPIP